MGHFIRFLLLAAILGGAGFWSGTHSAALKSGLDKALAHAPPSWRAALPALAESKPISGPVIYYRDPDGKPIWSSEMKKTPDGRDYVPVRASEEISLDPDTVAASAEAAPPDSASSRKIRYYRNPMGLPDTSVAPKTDSMGMAYIPVYEGEDSDDGSVKVSPGKLQRTGVRSEPAAMRVIKTPIRAPGTIQIDERRQSVMSLRFEGWIEKVEDVTTGAVIKKGQPLFRVYGPELSAAAAQYVSILESSTDGASAAIKGAKRRLENLGVPEGVIADIARAREAPLALSWPAPRDGIVVERNVSDGMRAKPGDALFKLADVSVVWALADIAERDLTMIAVGQQATVRPRGDPSKSVKGRIAVIYPEINIETRTARARIELPNPDHSLMPNMYTDVEIASGGEAPMLAIPENALVDSGDKQVVIIDKGDGKFEPRAVKTGRRGEGFVQIREGLGEGEQVVVSANFLIDAESNLKAALRMLETPK